MLYRVSNNIDSQFQAIWHYGKDLVFEKIYIRLRMEKYKCLLVRNIGK